jgi:hypothetical protein
MLLVEFEPTIPAFERAKTVHALDRAAAVISMWKLHAVNCVYGLEITKFVNALFHTYTPHRLLRESNQGL